MPPEQLPRLAGGNKGGGLMYAGHLVHAEKLVKQKRFKAPFPWFGGKSRVAPLVWQRLGEVDNYCEPFAGSAAVLLARPHPPRVETVNEAGDFTNAWRATDPDTGDPGAVADAACEVLNDLDPYVANAWRSIQRAPEETARWADRPVNELDMHAIHRWLVLGDGACEFRERMRADPDYYDPKRAGRWVVGLCEWIGSGWCASPDSLAEQRPLITGGGAKGGKGTRLGMGVHAKGERPHQSQQMPREPGRGDAAAGPGLSQQVPRIGTGGHGDGTVGVHQLSAGRPQLADAYSRGRGVHGTDAADRYLADGRRPFLSTGANTGDRGVQVNPERLNTCASRRAWLIDWFSRLRDRLRTVRVCSGHWLRVCDSESVTTRLGMTGLFLDPPYRHALKGGEKNRDSGLYGSDGTHSDQLVDEVIAYCLERGDNPQMRIAVCGYEREGYEALVEKGWECVAWSSQGGYANRNKKNRNRDRERLYFSPACVRPDLGLFRDFA